MDDNTVLSRKIFRDGYGHNHDFIELNSKKLDILVDYSTDADAAKGLYFLLLLLNLFIIFINGDFTNPIFIIGIIIYNIVSAIISYLFWCHLKSNRHEFIFNLDKDTFTASKMILGKVRKKIYNISAIDHIECKRYRSPDFDFSVGYYIYLRMKNNKKIQLASIMTKNLALEYSDELNSFLDIGVLYPKNRRKKFWK